jgi:hypothetical protein
LISLQKLFDVPSDSTFEATFNALAADAKQKREAKNLDFNIFFEILSIAGKKRFVDKYEDSNYFFSL